MENKKYTVVVFGRNGCPKCKVLNDRIDALLASDEWQDFHKEYVSLDTEEGLIRFCRTECVNPQRVPAFFVADGKQPLSASPQMDGSHLYQLIGLQTDYSDDGRGVISPRMIKQVFEEARAS